MTTIALNDAFTSEATDVKTSFGYSAPLMPFVISNGASSVFLRSGGGGVRNPQRIMRLTGEGRAKMISISWENRLHLRSHLI